jgi:hypothetical protein
VFAASVSQLADSCGLLLHRPWRSILEVNRAHAATIDASRPPRMKRVFQQGGRLERQPPNFTAIGHWDLGVRWSLGFGAWDLTLYKPPIQSRSLRSVAGPVAVRFLVAAARTAIRSGP